MRCECWCTSSGGTETGPGVEAVVIVDIEAWTDVPLSSLARLLVVVLELVLASSGDGAASERSTKEEISRLTVVAGFAASSCSEGRFDQRAPRWW